MENGMTNDEFEASHKFVEDLKKMNTKPKFVDSCLSRLEYSGGEKAGTVAKKYNVAVGEIGCKNCGVTIVGAIYKNECDWCGKPLI